MSYGVLLVQVNDEPSAFLTFVPVGHQDARHEFLLAVGPEGVSDHDLLLRQLPLQVQGIAPVELDLCCRTFRKGTSQKPTLKQNVISEFSHQQHLRDLVFCSVFSEPVEVKHRNMRKIVDRSIYETSQWRQFDCFYLNETSENAYRCVLVTMLWVYACWMITGEIN